jgi:hypothetical protein
MLGFIVTESLLLDHDGRKIHMQKHGNVLQWIDFRRYGPHWMGKTICRPAVLDVAAYCPKLAGFGPLSNLRNAW